MFKVVLTAIDSNVGCKPYKEEIGASFETRDKAELFMLRAAIDEMSSLNEPDAYNTPRTKNFSIELDGEHNAVIRLFDGENCCDITYYDIIEVKSEANSSKKLSMRIIDTADVSTYLEKRIIYTVALSENRFVDVMSLPAEHLFYVVQSADGKMVFGNYGNADADDANWTNDVVDEKEIISFVRSEIKRTAELDALMD